MENDFILDGAWENLISFEYSPEYNDFINRFEDSVDIRKLKSVDDLYVKMHDWLGKGQPTQKQMDFFTEYYRIPYYGVKVEKPEYKQKYFYIFTSNSMYNRNTSEFAKYNKRTGTTIYYKTEEARINFKYGERIVIRDIKTKRFVAHFYDFKDKKYLKIEKIEGD
jgi:hypothetical protein